MTDTAPPPPLSVAMSVYNGERFLAPAIESVLAQSFTSFEFLILDDGSTDASAAIIQRYSAKDSRIRPILRENRGLVASLNELLGESRAPLVARMDADDICLPDRFAKQIAFLDSHAGHGVVGCWSEDIDEFGEPWPDAGPDQPTDHEDLLARARQGRQMMIHPAVMYRREVVLGVGGYHSAFRHCEDYDLWLRLASTTRMANLPERLLRYRHYAGQVSTRHATEQAIGAAVAYEAWLARDAGRPDPTANLEKLPPVDALDALFDERGVSSRVRARVAASIQHSQTALRDEGFDILLRHIHDGGDRSGLWRTAARLVTFGEPARALRLANTLARAR
ncbi:glycosyltransferase [Aurantiacibacter aquimixticola]|uniref:Glycosyltransferase n=1 Tax=Aurantiacibacter aquimixticola TaxID=1958945 RepID=A0A419RVU9_9SPHN|nr:glycosyltransferase [Aurantiacibacter aquimixticola]RJY09901.1 glycosyltransferase [Aurantiacibacter aquimixticola]